MLLHIVLLMLGLEHNYSMPTASMQPTISIGDVFAMRTYRLYTVLGSSWFVPEPEIGDIVAVRSEFEPGAIFVKRVVAIGGDTVQMRAGRLYIDGELVERYALGQFQDSDSTGTAVSVTRYE